MTRRAWLVLGSLIVGFIALGVVIVVLVSGDAGKPTQRSVPTSSGQPLTGFDGRSPATNDRTRPAATA